MGCGTQQHCRTVCVDGVAGRDTKVRDASKGIGAAKMEVALGISVLVPTTATEECVGVCVREANSNDGGQGCPRSCASPWVVANFPLPCRGTRVVHGLVVGKIPSR